MIFLLQSYRRKILTIFERFLHLMQILEKSVLNICIQKYWIYMCVGKKNPLFLLAPHTKMHFIKRQYHKFFFSSQTAISGPILEVAFNDLEFCQIFTEIFKHKIDSAMYRKHQCWLEGVPEEMFKIMCHLIKKKLVKDCCF